MSDSMIEYCLMRGAEWVRDQFFPEDDPPPILAPEKGLAWLRKVPLEDEPVPAGKVLVEVREVLTATTRSWERVYRDQTPEEVEAAAVAAVAALRAYKDGLLMRVDSEAEAARLTFLTPGSGQALEYSETRAEAALAKTLPDEQLTAEAFPWLEAERLALEDAGQTGARLRQVEQAVSAQSAAWVDNGALIKRLRRGAKMRIEQSVDGPAALAVFPIDWPKPD